MPLTGENVDSDPNLTTPSGKRLADGSGDYLTLVRAFTGLKDKVFGRFQGVDGTPISK